jgi:hypothetical protein
MSALGGSQKIGLARDTAEKSGPLIRRSLVAWLSLDPEFYLQSTSHACCSWSHSSPDGSSVRINGGSATGTRPMWSISIFTGN